MIEQELTDSEVTPQHRHRRKLIEEQRKAKQDSVVSEEYLEFISDHQNKKGHKVRICRKMKSKNLQREWIGRSKDPICAEFISKWKKEGKKIVA